MRQRRSSSESTASYVVSSRVADPLLSSHGVNRLLVGTLQRPAAQEPPAAMPIHGILLGVGMGIVLWLALVGVALWIWGAGS
jgi:hypothetical protein